MNSVTILFVFATLATSWAWPHAPAVAAVVPGKTVIASGPVVAGSVVAGHVVGGPVAVGIPVAVGGRGLSGPLVNTVAAVNSGAISAANNAALRGANAWAHANIAAANDANALARQIGQASHANRAHAIQSAVDQANAINQLAALSRARAANAHAAIAQSSANQAALRQQNAAQATAAQLNAINGGGVRDAGIHQAGIIRQIAAVNYNAAHAAVLNRHGVLVPAVPLGWRAIPVALAPAGILAAPGLALRAGSKALLG